MCNNVDHELARNEREKEKERLRFTSKLLMNIFTFYVNLTVKFNFWFIYSYVIIGVVSVRCASLDVTVIKVKKLSEKLA